MKIWMRLGIVLLTAFILMSCATTSNHENPAQFITSSGITIAIKANIAADPDINSLLISVTTFKSIVTLSGYADSYEDEHQAILLAKQVNGVRAVVNNMVVRPAE